MNYRRRRRRLPTRRRDDFGPERARRTKLGNLAEEVTRHGKAEPDLAGRILDAHASVDELSEVLDAGR